MSSYNSNVEIVKDKIDAAKSALQRAQQVSRRSSKSETDDILAEALQAIKDCQIELNKIKGQAQQDPTRKLQCNQFEDTVKTLIKQLEQVRASVQKKEQNRLAQQLMSPEEREAEIQQSELNQAMQQQASYSAAILQEREQKFQGIHQDITNIREMSEDVNTMLAAQTETLTFAEDNTFNALHSTEKGTDNLKQANKWDRKARKKLCFLFLIILLVVAAIVIFVVVF